MSSLSHSPADVIRRMLIQLGLGTNPQDEGVWPIYTGNEPDSPDNLIALYDTAGMTNGRIQRTGETAEHRGIMVQVRGVDQPTTWDKMEAIKVALDESVHNLDVAVGVIEYVIHSITRHSGPLSLGREPNTNRFLFTLNAVVALEQIT